MSEEAAAALSGAEDGAALSDNEELRLKTLALEALVGAMASLAAWTGRIRKPDAQAMADQVEHATQGGGGAAGGEMASGAGRSTALAAIGAAAAAAAMNGGADEGGGGGSGAPKSGRSLSTADELAPSPSPPPGLSTGAHLASSFSTQFQFLRAQKQKLDTGVAKFNQKPKVGLAYLQQHGLLGTDAADIARFFHSNPALDKVQLGDFMGDEHAFNKAVLYAYVEQVGRRKKKERDRTRR